MSDVGADFFHGTERLLVLTNRLPFSFQRGRRGLERRSSVGGLASALDPVLLTASTVLFIAACASVPQPALRRPTSKRYRVRARECCEVNTMADDSSEIVKEQEKA